MGIGRAGLAMALGLLAAAAAGPAAVLAQEQFPAKPVRMIVPLAPGGAIDLFARSLGAGFEARTGQAVVVESRAGANTIIAANACKQSAPDGYTVCLLTRSTISINPEIYRKLSYEPLKDFEPITNAFFGQQIVILNRNVPVKSFKEFVAYSKAEPDKLNYGSFGLGGDSHLIIEWLKSKTGASITHVPFKGASDAMLAFTANNVQMIALLVGNPDLARQVREGEVKGLLLPGNKRSALVPDVETFAEAGLTADDTAFAPWFGLFAPKGTPRPIVDKLNGTFTAIIKTPAFRDKFLIGNAFTPVADSPEAFTRFIVEDRKTAAGLVEISGVKLNE